MLLIHALEPELQTPLKEVLLVDHRLVLKDGLDDLLHGHLVALEELAQPMDQLPHLLHLLFRQRSTLPLRLPEHLLSVQLSHLPPRRLTQHRTQLRQLHPVIAAHLSIKVLDLRVTLESKLRRAKGGGWVGCVVGV